MNPRRLLGLVPAAALIAGCGGSSSGASTTTISTATTAAASSTARSSIGPTTKPSLLAFARCMRAHGVPNYPDPKPPGQLPTTRALQPAPSGGFTANPNAPAYQNASHDCNSLAVATRVGQGQQNQAASAQLKFAMCMRAHGVPNFPDPTSSGEFGDNGAINGENPSSPAVQRAEEQCSKFRFVPPGLAG